MSVALMNGVCMDMRFVWFSEVVNIGTSATSESWSKI